MQTKTDNQHIAEAIKYFNAHIAPRVAQLSENYKKLSLSDLPINIQKITPDQYEDKNGKITIYYQYSDTAFGEILVASTHKGVCYLGFQDKENQAFDDLKSRFPNANFIPKADTFQQEALNILQGSLENIQPISLHLKGTDFQLKVWEKLLQIPFGKLATYGEIAQKLGNPNASRAVGTAIGSNPIAFLIPCHRVIQSSGKLGGYMWGLNRKKALIGWEASVVNH